MKKIKNYFLFVSRKPILCAILSSASLFLVYVLFIIIAESLIKINGDALIGIGVSVVIILACLLAVINLLVSAFMVTSFPLDKKTIVLIYREEGNPEIYKKPIWGKYPYNIIELPDKWSWPLWKKSKDLILFVTCIVDGKKLFIPFRLSFHFLSELNAYSLQTIIMAQEPETKMKKIIKLEDCIKYIFEKYNLTPEKREAIETIIGDWARKQEPLAQISMALKKEIAFPDNLFFPVEIETKPISLGIRFLETTEISC